jgi:hypothetical protein
VATLWKEPSGSRRVPCFFTWGHSLRRPGARTREGHRAPPRPARHVFQAWDDRGRVRRRLSPPARRGQHRDEAGNRRSEGSAQVRSEKKNGR